MMFKNKFAIGIGFSLAASASFAGGLDRSTYSSGILFENGNAFRIGISYIDPTVKGKIGGVKTGDMADTYTQLSIGFKGDVNDHFSYALMVDTPYGANVNYSATSPAQGTKATLSSFRVAALLKYTFNNDRVSVYAGPIAEQISGSSVKIPSVGYSLSSDSSTGFGYAIGAAYEVPDRALRMALTYAGAIEHDIDVIESGNVSSTVKAKTPQTVTLEMQTGLNSRTLLSGSIRWSDWSEFKINPPVYSQAASKSLVEYDNDVVTLGIGLGYKFTDKWAFLGGVEHEASSGGDISLLSPTDGKTTLNIGTQYTASTSKFRIGISYALLGDAKGTFPTPFEFSDSSAIGVGISFTQGF